VDADRQGESKLTEENPTTASLYSSLPWNRIEDLRAEKPSLELRCGPNCRKERELGLISNAMPVIKAVSSPSSRHNILIISFIFNLNCLLALNYLTVI
jgi:hypothetical protein